MGVTEVGRIDELKIYIGPEIVDDLDLPDSGCRPGICLAICGRVAMDLNWAGAVQPVQCSVTRGRVNVSGSHFASVKCTDFSDVPEGLFNSAGGAVKATSTQQGLATMASSSDWISLAIIR